MCDQMQLFPDIRKHVGADQIGSAAAKPAQSGPAAAACFARHSHSPRKRSGRPTIFQRPGFCMGCGEETCICDHPGRNGAITLEFTLALPIDLPLPIIERIKRLRGRLTSLGDARLEPRQIEELIGHLEAIEQFSHRKGADR